MKALRVRAKTEAVESMLNDQLGLRWDMTWKLGTRYDFAYYEC